MNWTDSFSNMEFNRQQRSIPRIFIALCVSQVIFTLTWILLSETAMFWLCFFSLAVFTWIASFGWRDALSRFILFLHRLEKL